jgi:EAL domain-containing protein (putative c-di-GMP-specific phosphodiesterase class I)/ActR/RegA family two-component response regulator
VTAVTVLIAEGDRLVADAVLELLSAERAIEIVGLARNGDEAIEMAAARCPAIALVDVRMPAGGGARVTRALTGLSPAPRVIAHSAFDAPEGVIEMLRAGAVGYVVKGGPIDELPDAIHGVAGGRFALSPTAAQHVTRALVSQLEREDSTFELRRVVSARIRAALEPGAIGFVFQPIVDLGDRSVVGHEALARFAGRPQRPPDVWFKEAHSVGMGVELELAALRGAIRAVKLGGEDIGRCTFLSLNASPVTVVAQGFTAALGQLAPLRTVVEVTEHAPIADYRAFNSALREQRRQGARLGIDDVGAGYASMRHIVQLEPDFIKIDLSLTRGLASDPSRRALALALISFAGAIGASVIAEGLETEEDIATMHALGAHLGQGYGLGRPAAIVAAAR